MDYVACHHAAMEALDEAARAMQRKDESAAKAATRRALELEAKAAGITPFDLEPTRSVLHRSAASIAAELGDTIQTRRLVFEGLRGNTPIEIKAELFEVLDGLIPVTTNSDQTALVQQLRIRRGSRKARSLTIPMVAGIQRSWFSAIDELTDGMNRFVPIDAGVGSFVVRFEIQREDRDFGQIFAALDRLRDSSIAVASLRQKRGSSRKRIKLFQGVRRITELLATLRDADAVLEITTHGENSESPRSFDLYPPSHSVLEILQTTISDHITSIDIPQADDLAKIFLFVTIVSRGHYPTPETLQVVNRQVNYYRRAAEILGYLRDRRLTPGGRLLAQSAEPMRWKSALVSFTASDVGSAWIEWSGESTLLDVDPASAVDFLHATAVGLSEATLRRRAKTIASWQGRLSKEIAALHG